MHPDEHFQAAAPAAAVLLGWTATLPWSGQGRSGGGGGLDRADLGIVEHKTVYFVLLCTFSEREGGGANRLNCTKTSCLRAHHHRLPPWVPREFAAAQPARSLLHPAVAAAAPLLALEWIGLENWRTSWALLVGSRLPTLLASFVIGKAKIETERKRDVSCRVVRIIPLAS